MKPVELLCCIALCAFAAPGFAQMTPTQRTTSDGRPLASSLPPKKGQAPRTQAHPLAFEELAQHVGDRIKLTTIYGAQVEGHIDSVRGQTLRLRISAGLGFAITNFERAKIRSVVSFG
jgi:hypothetical protein